MLGSVTDRVDRILKEALELPAEDRERLARELLETVDDEVHIEPDELARIEAEADAILAGRARTEPWDAVHERLLAKYRK